MKPFILAAILATSARLAGAADIYALDASHSQILFSYDHMGYSTTWGMFSGFEGEISFDKEDPAASSVAVSMPTKAMFTGWEARTEQFLSEDFFGATDKDSITFVSRRIEVTGENTADITGDLSMNDVTRSVVLAARLNQTGMHMISNKAWIGFDATTTLLRSEFGLGQFAPFISDEVSVQISIEAGKVN